MKLALALLLVVTGVAAIIFGMVMSWLAGLLALVGAVVVYVGTSKVDVDQTPSKSEEEPPFKARSAL